MTKIKYVFSLDICHYQAGQTLIETLVAVFMLTTGVTATLGLAIYALSSSSSASKQIIATGLAREGIEAVKNMRDTNWLKTSRSVTCYNFATGQSDAYCYPDWLRPNGSDGNADKHNDIGFDLLQSPGHSFATTTYRLSLNTDASKRLWRFGSDNGNFGLDFDPDLSGDGGFYTTDVSHGVANGSSDYYRKITLSFYTASPYNQADLGPMVKVQSQVWWKDKNCPRVADWPGLGKCSVEMDTYLTNWKNY